MRRTLSLAAAGAVLLGACGGPAGKDAGRDRELVVSAAASLADAFPEIGRAFEAANPGVAVAFNFGPSDGLAGQIVEGAPVDVFVSASPAWMDAVAEGPGVIGRADVARNRLTVIVPAENPGQIERIEDLARDGVRLVLAAEGVPAGDYAREILAKAGIAEAALANLVSNEDDVRGVVAKVLAGDADAGIVYATDATPDAAAGIRAIPIPDDLNVVATYTIAVVGGSEQVDLAKRFVDFVLDEGRETLADHGFLPA